MQRRLAGIHHLVNIRPTLNQQLHSTLIPRRASNMQWRISEKIPNIDIRTTSDKKVDNL
jgi:hypothetical protein